MSFSNMYTKGYCPVFKEQKQICITVEKGNLLSSEIEHIPRRYDCPYSDSCTVIEDGEDCPIFVNFSYH